MELTSYVTSVRDDLTAAAAVGDESTARAGSALSAALEPAVRLALMTALSDLTAEISDALGDRTVGLRLEGRAVRVVVEGADRSPGAGPATTDPGPDTPGDDGGFFAGPSGSPFAPPHPFGTGFGTGGRSGGPFGGDGGGPDVGDISRMTLRIVDQIKGQAEQAAAAQGMSLNSWVSQAVQGALRDASRAGGWGGRRHGHESTGTDDAPDPDQR